MIPASASPRDGTPDGAAFGAFLRQARERRGLTLQQISSETKIPWRHLDALEHGWLDAVPGGTYRRGEIRAYAEVVGLDKATALERLESALGASAPVTTPARASSGARRQQMLLSIACLVIGLVAVMAFRDRTPFAKPAAPLRVEPLRASPTIAPSASMIALPSVRPEASLASSDETGATAPLAMAGNPGAEPGLRITSNPPGARVTVDGIAWGVTPVTLHHVAPGDRRVRVTMPSFTAAERQVHVADEAASQTLHVVLERLVPR